MEMIGPARNTNKVPIVPRKARLYRQVIQTDFSARSGRPAPRFWPTRVAAALLIPQEGRMANAIMRMPTVYPATGALPNPDRIRMSPSQLVMLIKPCTIPVPEIRTMVLQRAPRSTGEVPKGSWDKVKTLNLK